ncbi:uncharacterized protein [Miscanthus floridulus]|uniref:uncharacterized protein n=1 Tax=Miscanthus floridulus TaxID=154761 RepID=UPI00345B4AC2
MPPRPSLHSPLLMAASASSSAAASGGDLGLLFAARRRLPVAAASMAAAGGHRIRLLHSSPGRVPRRPEVACCVRSAPDARRYAPAPLRSRNVHSANYTASSEERLGQLIQNLKNEGINPKQWKLGNFQRMLCPQCNGGSKGKGDLSLSVYIRRDGMNATWNCFRSKCGWRGFIQPDGVTNISQGKTDIESETDQEVKAKKTANKVYRKVSEKDLNLEPLCEEVSKSTFDLMEALDAKVVATIMQKLDAVAGQVNDLRKKVDVMVEKLDAAAGQVDDLSKKVDAMVENLDAAAGQVDDLSKKVDAKAEKLDAVAGQVGDLSKVDAMDEKLNAPTADNK